MFDKPDIVIRRKGLLVTIDLKFESRGFHAVFRYFPVSRASWFSAFPILANHQIKHHIRGNDPHIRLIESLMFRRVDADLKVHPLPEIFRIPAAFRIPAGIAFHSDLIPHRCLVVFLFICHIASDSILICGHRTIIVDPDRIPAPGHLIQILSHHRFRDIFILGCVKPSHVSPCGSIVPHTLGLDLRDIPDKLFSENKLRIQGARSVRKRQYLKWHCRIFRSCSPDRIRSFFSRRQPDGGRLLHNSDRAVFNFRIVSHPGKFCPCIVFHILYDIGTGRHRRDLRIKTRIKLFCRVLQCRPVVRICPE